MTPPSPKPAKDTVYIDLDDEITSIIDKVEGAKNKVVALVLPKRTSALKSIVNMRLLKRSAENADKNVVLITSEQALMPLAGAAGVHVSKNLQSKPEIPDSPLDSVTSEEAGIDVPDGDEDNLDAKRPIGELAKEHEGDSEAIDLDDEEDEEKGPAKKDKPPKDKRLKVPNFERFRLVMIAGVGGAFLLIFLLIFGTFVWPKATITIRTESTPISTNFSIRATDKAKALDEAGGVIPAVLKTSDMTNTEQVPATAQQNNGAKATGSVTVSQICTVPPPAVDSGTGLSSGGLVFITAGQLNLSTITPSGGHFVCSGSVAVTAQQGGTKYNLPANSTFSVAGHSDMSGSNGSAFSGGTDNNVTVVGQADIDTAKAKIDSPDIDKFTKAFEKQLTDAGLYVIASTLKGADPAVTANPAIGQPATTVTVGIKTTYSVLTIQKSDLAKVINDKLQKQIDTKKQKVSSNDVVKDASVAVQTSGSPNEAVIQVSESTTAIPTLDVASIQKQVEGLKAGDIRNLISEYPGVKNVDAKMSPFWVTKAPKKPAKIHVILQQVKSN